MLRISSNEVLLNHYIHLPLYPRMYHWQAVTEHLATNQRQPQARIPRRLVLRQGWHGHHLLYFHLPR